jgi:hypothetical protein
MNRYRAVVAEVATGKVRRPGDVAARAQHGESVWRTFESEEALLRFVKDILESFPDLEVTVIGSAPGERGRVFIREGEKIQFREFTPDEKKA